MALRYAHSHTHCTHLQLLDHGWIFLCFQSVTRLHVVDIAYNFQAHRNNKIAEDYTSSRDDGVKYSTCINKAWRDERWLDACDNTSIQCVWRFFDFKKKNMFSNKHGKSHGHGKPKKESNSKKHHIRNWMHSKKKKKHEANLFPWVLFDTLD